MYPLVVHSLLAGHKFSVAKVTVITAVSAMRSFMLITYIFSTKRFTTNSTQKGSRLAMGMPLKGVSPCKCHATFIAFVRPYP